MIIKKENVILLLILLTAAILRFYNLMHDAPHFFNPDERNLAGAVSQFRLPSQPKETINCIASEFISPIFNPSADGQISNCNLNPHFFAYGQFPLYLSFISDQVVKLFSNILPYLSTNNHELITNNYLSTSFPLAVFWLRFYSALSSTFTVLLVYLISKFLIHNSKFIILAALSAAFSPGLIQAAHFGTTESLLTFFFLASVYLSIRYFDNNIKYQSLKKSIIHNSKSGALWAILNSLVIGLALGSKLTGMFFFVPPLISLMIKISQRLRKPGKNCVIVLLGYWVIVLFLLVGSFFFFILSSPYNLAELQDFKSAVFGYEADVATGRFDAFYTRQFVNTIPILFQIEKIFPYALGLPFFILGSL